MKNSNFLGDLFAYISRVINGAEKSLLDLLSALVPYFVPIIPAYLTYYHTRDQMSFPVEVAWTAAFVVEVLGMTSISTAIRFYRHNQRYAKSLTQNKAPFGLAIFTYAFYLTVVLSVNVLLEVEAAKREPVIILAIALFSLLSVPSGVLISIRSQYSEMLEDREARRNPQKQSNEGLQFTPLNLDVPFGEGRDKLRKICQSCGREFVTTYPNKKTCSDACRKRLSRDKSGDVP